VTVEESNTFGIELEFTEGMQFDKGYLSPYFVTDAERQEAVLEDAYILLFTESKISLGPGPRPGAREGHADRQAAADHRRGHRGRGPRHPRGQQDPWHLQLGGRQGPRLRRAPQGHARDMAILTGGQVISETVGLKLENTTLDLLGTARKVVITKDNTTIVEGGGSADDVNGRVAQIKREIDETDSDWDREKLQERLAKLAGGVAVVKVGAATEVELKEKKHRIEDALSATRAAIEEGIVAGGGTALVRARAAVAGQLEALDGDEPPVPASVAQGLDAPPAMIADNAGLEGAVVVQADRA
jgi:chaperonin GroEL